MLFIKLQEEFPKFKIHVKPEAAYLGEKSCSHMYVSKQITNLKCETKSRPNMNYISDELVCRRRIIIAIGKYEIRKLDIGEQGVGEHGIGEHGIGEHGIGELLRS